MSRSSGSAPRKLSDRLLPDARTGALEAVLATTFEMQPDFVDTDLLPTLLELHTQDERSLVGRVAIERELARLDSVTLLMEPRRYRDRGRSRHLRVDVVPAPGLEGKLHAKVMVLLFAKAVRVIVGSANLTDNGYRKNREVALTLTSYTARPSVHDALVREALLGFEQHLDAALTGSARETVRKALARTPTSASVPDTSFAWSSPGKALWPRFVELWPKDEAIEKLTLVSPFWAQEAADTLGRLLDALRERGGITPQTEVWLITAAHALTRTEWGPMLPPSFKAHDWRSLGVRVTAQAADPSVSKEEVDGMEDFIGTRDLHAKLVIAQGARHGVAYLGSANFTAHGWGFAGRANVEAGVLLRRPSGHADLDALAMPVCGKCIELGGPGMDAITDSEVIPADPPWPKFILRVVLNGNAQAYHLAVDLDVQRVPAPWRMELRSAAESPAVLVTSDASTAPKPHLTVPLSADHARRLFVEQQVWAVWPESPDGSPLPVNAAIELRHTLPLLPDQRAPNEDWLLAYFQGRVDWQSLWNDPDEKPHALPASLVTPRSVDTTGIQAYQMREFVEALAGVRRHLMNGEMRTAGVIRLELLGPISPLALARAAIAAENSSQRSATAAAFQLAELLTCVRDAKAREMPEPVRADWLAALREAETEMHAAMRTLAVKLGPSSAFERAYRQTLAVMSAKP
jgi:phosphatidylserine/phosphatidylglycerophosphate/cardiolipin synthase-like enzyme